MRVFIKNILIRLHLYSLVLFLVHFYFVILKVIKLHKVYKKNILLYNSINRISEKNEKILFLINNPYLLPYLYPVMHFLNKKNYTIVLKYNYRFISLLQIGFIKILQLENLHIKQLKEIKNINYSMLFYDEKNKSLLKKVNASKYIFLNTNFITDGNQSYMPYTLHQLIYCSESYNKIESYRNNKRKMRVFFAGNTNKDRYTRYKIENIFKIINRNIIINTLLEQIDIIEKIESQEQFEHILQSNIFLKKIVLILTDIDSNYIQKENIRIPIDNWLETLSYADFFIACPGIQIPYSHNVIEAMSIGTIPIIQYGSLFSPPLKHLENCIEFVDLDDLNQKIRFVLSMNQNEIDKLKQNVILYYDNHLNYNKYVNQIIYSFPNKIELLLCVEKYKIFTLAS